MSYLSPELTHEAEASPQSDIFSLGVVLWETLCGGKLFPGKDPVELVRAIRETNIPPPREQRPDIPEHLEQIVLKALAHDPADRFASAKEMARQLAMLLRDTTQSTDSDQISTSVAWVRRQAAGPLQQAGTEEVSFDQGIPLTRKKATRGT